MVCVFNVRVSLKLFNAKLTGQSLKNFTLKDQINFMKSFLAIFFFSSICTEAFSQNTISVDLNSDISLPVGADKFKTYLDPENSFSLHHYAFKKWENPFLSLKATALYSINKNLSAGLQTGVIFFLRETHFIEIKRTFPAFPIQAAVVFDTKINNTKSAGIKLAPGLALYRIDDYIFQVKNAFLIDGEIFYKFSKRSRIKIGFSMMKEWTHFKQFLEPRQKTVQHEFTLNRNSVYVGYGFKLR